MANPIVRVGLELGTFSPVVDPDDDEWHPLEYVVRAHHATELSADATTVVERRLERLTLVRTNAEPDAHGDGAPPVVELPLPDSVEDLEALISLLDHARDYLAQERPA